jgi:hypothetical protein
MIFNCKWFCRGSNAESFEKNSVRSFENWRR